MNELDSARSYLGLPALSEEDHESLQVFCNEDGELEFDVSFIMRMNACLRMDDCIF